MTRLLLGLLFLSVAACGSARAGDYYYGGAVEPYNSWRGDLPACDEPGVLSRVAEKFAYADAHVILSGLAIAHFDRIRQNALRAGGPGLIDRRYCSATAWMSNGRKSEAVYLIESRQGFASLGWNVESCLTGFDPYHVYDAWCRSIRP
jgi:hypothetical protein